MPDVAKLPQSTDQVVAGSTGHFARSTDAGVPVDNPGNGRVRLNLDLSTEVASFLETLAQENATTKTDVMRKAIALLKIAHEEKKRNRSMGFVQADRDMVLETKVVGVL